jgi:hypothetical protein
MSQPDFETVKSNWETFENLCGRLSDNNINMLLATLGERLITTPNNTHDSDTGCCAGGLIQMSLEVTSNMRKISSTFDLDISTSSILKVGLLHEIGKVGTLEKNLFVEQDSDWHREKLGQFYKYNEDILKATVPDRTLFLLQHFGVKLSPDEFYAIRLSQGAHHDENRFYLNSTPSLANCLQVAKKF